MQSLLPLPFGHSNIHGCISGAHKVKMMISDDLCNTLCKGMSELHMCHLLLECLIHLH